MFNAVNVMPGSKRNHQITGKSLIHCSRQMPLCFKRTRENEVGDRIPGSKRSMHRHLATFRLPPAVTDILESPGFSEEGTFTSASMVPHDE